MVGIPSAFAGPSEIVVIADETDAGRPRRHRRDRAGRARPQRPGVAHHLVRRRSADAVDAAIAELVAASPRRAEIESTFAEGGYAVLVDAPAQADRGRQPHRPRAPRSS